MAMIFRATFLICLCYCASASSELVNVYSIALDRALYSEARHALKKNDRQEYSRLRRELEEINYPLIVYLDYREISGKLSRLSLSQAKSKLEYYDGTPLKERFWRNYLTWLGQAKRWSNFLNFYELMPSESPSETLRCYHARALRGVGKLIDAWSEVRKLWIYGGSRPSQCDPIFKLWLKSKEFDDSAVKGRMLAAFDEGNRGLMNYASRFGSADLESWSNMVKRIYSRPHRINRYKLPTDDIQSSELISVALVKLSRTDPRDTLAFWNEFRLSHDFDKAQIDRIERAIAKSLIRNAPRARKEWLTSFVSLESRSDLLENWLRYLLAKGEWEDILPLIQKLSKSFQEKPVWQYWKGRSEQAIGQYDKARETFGKISKDRHYYGFLAAEQLSHPYKFNEQKIQFRETDFAKLSQNASFQRLKELRFHDETDMARIEWRALLSVLPTDQKEQLVLYSRNQSWGNWGILAAKKTFDSDRLHNAVEIRFPLEYIDLFAKFAKRRNLSPLELMAIARRESAFNPRAGSSAGARGLMQLMPATARLVAKEARLKFRLSELSNPEKNVELGSAYYKSVLKKYRGNRILALAAYNAGPSAVKRWRKKSNRALDAARWIEVIPYQETRDYVQAVLAYRSVYAYRVGAPVNLMSSDELKAKY